MNNGDSFLLSDGKPSLSHGTLVVVPLLPKGSTNNSPWAASVEDIDDNQLKVQVF